MDYPPWLPTPENTHAGRILAIARCIFDMHVRTENHAVKGPIRTFDNMCSGNLEKAAKVLNLAGYTEFIDDIGRRSVFSCEPENFPQIAISAQAGNVDPQLVTEAVMRLAGGPVGSTEEIEYLAKEMENES